MNIYAILVLLVVGLSSVWIGQFFQSMPDSPIIQAQSREEALARLSSLHRGQLQKTEKFKNATLIEPYRIYLGSYWNAADEEFIKEKNITKIFHFATGRPVIQILPHVTEVYSSTLRYRTKSPNAQFEAFRAAAAQIHQYTSAGDVILVHCMRGRSRSVSVVLAYLMEYHSLSFQKARELVKQFRPAIGPHEGLVEQLIAYEEFLQTTGSDSQSQ